MGRVLNGMVFCLMASCAIGRSSLSWAATMLDPYQSQVQTKCSFTRYPALCVQTLTQFRDHPVDFMYALINKTIEETTNLPNSYFSPLSTTSSQLETREAQHAQFVSGYCKDLTEMSLKQLHQSLLALKDSPTKNKHDIQTWLSAAMTFQQACKDSAADGRDLSTAHIARKMDYLSQLASNSLALVNRITSKNSEPNKNKTKSRHLTEELRDFPYWVSAKDRKLLQTNKIEANAVVAQDGTGNYKTVSEAIEAASGNGQFVIYVKKGVYKEKIQTDKDGITLIGDGKYSTIITADSCVAGGSPMPETATFTITGNRFMARDIGFQNTAGPNAQQALALYVASDYSVFYRCSIYGYQDTLYALANRQFYRECDIYGTIDFIFGNAAAVFQRCCVALNKPAHGAYNVILASGRYDPEQSTGFVLQNCWITASQEFSPFKNSVASYLARPWKQYSRSVVMQSAIDDAISPTGYVEWPGQGSYANTLYFAEHANKGAGAGTSGRVQWPGFHVIGAEEAVQFTVGTFINGTSWLPPTGVPFNPGLY